ncbi:hypothetical protein SAMN02745866_01731 [Alteromonadaceae bacterium Bs31]|nr:hypothetical protein SAMN02745866_01731 [Alteromonadaceae bacterium Bs31]
MASPPHSTSSSHSKLLTVFSISVWALVTLATFWWYEIRNIRPFGESTVFFEAQSIPVPPEFIGNSSVKLVHFHEPGCYCNAPSQEHLQAIINTYQFRNVEFFSISNEEHSTIGENADKLIAIDHEKNAELYQLIPSSPGVAIWDSNNKLAYFGPYSLGPSCDSRNGFVEGVLENLIVGQEANITSTVGTGCFCQWQESKKT